MTVDMGLMDVFKKTDSGNILGNLSNILDSHDMEIVAVRGKGCEVLYSSARTVAELQSDASGASGCKTDYAMIYPKLCDHCPQGRIDRKADNELFEIKDTDGRTFAVRCKQIDWVDGKPATVFTFRDITPEKEIKERLYKLAYIDQLTHIPNRQKLKEDFNALEDDINSGALEGIVVIFDLDNFKDVNDTYGHNTGDVVLRRLTEHLGGEGAFAGHLYRLGGDEFVLLYSNHPTRFDTAHEMREYYNELLSSALCAYTLPNIDVKCTLSMGVSFFPKNGSTLSDLLRKADIALYKAKIGGRNQIVFFEDRYDTAQKFKDMYINIQPVLLGFGKTFGYELIDSGNNAEKDGKTVSLSEFNRTLDTLGLQDIENDLHYFISYSKNLLNPAVLNNLPKNKFIVQLAIPAKQSKIELKNSIKKCSELRKNGYRLAISGPSSSSHMTELLSLVDYCKFNSSDVNEIRQRKVIGSNPGTRFIATGVDTQEDFRKAKEAGFHMFQGYYFNQPILGQKTKEISPLKINYFRLLKLSGAGDYMDFREVSSIISSDVALTYKLLRILNSAAVGLRNVSSVASAVAYMGEESMKKWIAVLALRGIADDKPLELVRMSLIRARFGELLAPHFLVKRDPQQVFMVGMLSLLHIALEKTREQMLEEVPVSDEIRESLLTKSGTYSDLLRFYENYEYANWEAVSLFVEENRLEPTYVNDAYIASVKWYSALADT